MARVNRSISVPEDLSARIDAAARAEGITSSAWITDTVLRRLLAEEGVHAEAHRQSVAVAVSENAADDQAFIDAVSLEPI